MFSKAALVASLTAMTQAILLPPSISSSDIEIVNNLPFEVVAQADSRTVNLQCTGCPVAVAQKGGKTTWMHGVDSQLLLDFSIEHGQSDILYMNGVQFFPPRLDQNHVPEPLTALQVAAGTKPSDASNQHLRLGYELLIRPAVRDSKDGIAADIALINIHFQIAEIGDKFVDGLESVELKLLKTSSGKLMIVDQKIAPTTNAGGADCQTMICKFRNIISDKLSAIKSGKKGCSQKAGAMRPHGHGRPGPFQHGRHGRHGRHRFAHFMHTLKNIAFHVLIPVFIGVAVGMTASIVGMIAGQMIVFFWRAIYRNGQGNYSHIEQEESFEEGEEEEKSLVENQGPPPVYEDFKDEKTAL